MNTDKIYAEQIANEYAPKDTSKVVALPPLLHIELTYVILLNTSLFCVLQTSVFNTKCRLCRSVCS